MYRTITISSQIFGAWSCQCKNNYSNFVEHNSDQIFSRENTIFILIITILGIHCDLESRSVKAIKTFMKVMGSVAVNTLQSLKDLCQCSLSWNTSVKVFATTTSLHILLVKTPVLKSLQQLAPLWHHANQCMP